MEFLDLDVSVSLASDDEISEEEASSSLSGFIVPDGHPSTISPPRSPKRARLTREGAFIQSPLPSVEEPRTPPTEPVSVAEPAPPVLPGVGGIAGSQHKNQVRINAARLAITWPQLEAAGSDTSCLDLAREGFTKLAEEVPIETIVICREKHEDGAYHVHAYLCFPTRRKITHQRLDDIVGKHGNYCRVLSQVAWLKYITKDSEFLGYDPSSREWSKEYALLVVGAADAKSGVKHAKIEKLLKEGGTVLDIQEQHPGYLIQHAHKVKYYQELVAAAEASLLKPKFQWKDIELTNEMQPHDFEIALWLNSWFSKIRDGQRPYPKQLRHLAIIGQADSGKTRLSTYLMTHLIPTFLYVNDGGFLDALSDEDELVVFNDFWGSMMSYSQWKRFTDGSPIQRRVKGGAPKLWNKVIPMIFTANKPPEDWWTNLSIEEDVVRSRLQIVHIPPGAKINLFGFKYD